uniref:Uncharacterized protein n=1 Tax=Arundo donax TaxID=35708 RepID=A0A0A9GMU4_ARUDO
MQGIWQARKHDFRMQRFRNSISFVGQNCDSEYLG